MAEGIALKTLDSKEHGTPDWIIKKLLQHSSRTAFDLDPAATPENAKALIEMNLNGHFEKGAWISVRLCDLTWSVPDELLSED